MPDGEHAGVAVAQHQPEDAGGDQRAAEPLDAQPPVAGPGEPDAEADTGQDDEVEQPADGRRVAPRRLLGRHQVGQGLVVGHAPAAFSAIATMLDSSIARVIGPTPPGLGETQPATSQTSVGDVAGDLAVDPRDAHVEHGRTRLDHVGGDDAGHAGRGDHDVGGAGVRGQVAGAGVAQGDGGVLASGGSAAGRAAGRPSGRARRRPPRRRRAPRRGAGAARCSRSGCTAAAPPCRAPASRG